MLGVIRMVLLERLGWKISRAKRLIVDGRYKDLLSSIGANLPVFLNPGKRNDHKIYSALHKKYSSFIAEHVNHTRENYVWGGLTLI